MAEQEDGKMVVDWAVLLRAQQQSLGDLLAALRVHMERDSGDSLYHVHRYVSAALVEIGRALREAEGAGGRHS